MSDMSVEAMPSSKAGAEGHGVEQAMLLDRPGQFKQARDRTEVEQTVQPELVLVVTRKTCLVGRHEEQGALSRSFTSLHVGLL